MEHGPQLCNVSGKGDIRVKHNDSLQVGRESLGQDELHQTINARVVFVGDPGNFRLHQEGKRRSRKKGKKRIIMFIFYINIINSTWYIKSIQ